MRSKDLHGVFRRTLVGLGVAGLSGAVLAGVGDFRSYDGTGNNLANPGWGSKDRQLLRLTTVDYADGMSAPARTDQESARAISNAVCDQAGLMPNSAGASNFLWQWGQFIDHDMDLSDLAMPVEPFNILVPVGDPVFDPDSNGGAIIPLNRSIFDVLTGDSPGNPRQQINEITAFIDGSQVFGSDEARATALRTNDGTGRLLTSEGNLLPFNTMGLLNLGGPDPSLFVAGDIRANEQVGLTTMHTLFVREHNRQAALIADDDSSSDSSDSDSGGSGSSGSSGSSDATGAAGAGATGAGMGMGLDAGNHGSRALPDDFPWESDDDDDGSDDSDDDGEAIYQEARARVGALIQVVTYNEFLPLLLGPDALEPYTGYDPDVDATMANVFTAAAFRVGHTLLSPTLLRLDADGNTIPEGDLPLQDAFFANQTLVTDGGIEPVLRGLASDFAQEIDAFVIDDVRNFLFLAPDPSGLDLPALNIQRGRDHGLPGYNQVRIDLGLAPAATFADISSNPNVQAGLAEVYAGPDDVDPWVGAVAEDHLPGAMVGELIFTVLKDQFERLRDGDRYYYENVFSPDEVAELSSTTLADIIRRNTTIDAELQDDAFRVPAALECTGDANGDGEVGVLDLIQCLNSWGQASADGVVGVLDLLEVVMNWGPCPE